MLNKVVINQFQNYPHWWKRITSEQDFSNLQQVKWITLGGVGELPTVAEGAAYTELTWDDQTETADFVKKGGYLGLTLEAMDKDDTRRLRAAPRALAQAAWLTLSKLVSGIFTDSDLQALTRENGTLVADVRRRPRFVDLDKCIGCGLCVSTCPSEAISLIRKSPEEIVLPPVDEDDWFRQRGKMRGVDYSRYA